MPATVTPDIVKGTRIEEDDYGLKVIRNYLIEGIGPDSGALKAAWEHDDFPEYGQPDDDFPELIARQITVTPFTESSKVKARGQVVFRPPDFSSAYSPIISYISTSRSVRSCFDFEGKLILIRYLGPTPSGNQTIYTKVGQREDSKPIGILEIQRIESQFPKAAVKMQGCVSATGFQGDPKWFWLLKEVNTRQQLYRSGHNVYYRFERDFETHVQTIAYTDAFGHVPTNISPVDKSVEYPANPPYGWRNFVRGPLADFNVLQLPVVLG